MKFKVIYWFFLSFLAVFIGMNIGALTEDWIFRSAIAIPSAVIIGWAFKYVLKMPN